MFAYIENFSSAISSFLIGAFAAGTSLFSLEPATPRPDAAPPATPAPVVIEEHAISEDFRGFKSVVQNSATIVLQPSRTPKSTVTPTPVPILPPAPITTASAPAPQTTPTIAPATPTPAPKIKRYADFEKKAYDAFRAELAKIIADEDAGVAAFDKSKESYAAANYGEALRLAEEERTLFGSAYQSTLAMEKNPPQDIPWTDLAKKLLRAKKYELQYVKSSADYRTLKINGQLSGNLEQRDGASQEEAVLFDKGWAYHAEFDALLNELHGKAIDYFQ